MTKKYKPLKTDFTKESPINISKVNPELHNRINSYVNLMNENKTSDKNKKYKVRDYILNLIEEDLNGLVLDNTFIKLDKEYSFSKSEFDKNKKATATTKPIIDKEDAIIITEVPNNLDNYNNEKRSYYYGDKSSIHAGYYIFNDIHYYFIYDSQEEEIEVKVVDSANMKYYVEDDKLKEKLLNDNSFVMDGLKKKLSIDDLHKTSSRPIMYRYVNFYEIDKTDYSEPFDVGALFNFFFEL